METPLEVIHFYVTDRCNLNCPYCFTKGHLFGGEESKLLDITEAILELQPERVVLTGGEPLLVDSLDRSLDVFRKSEIYVSLHTNGILLDKERLNSLKGRVQDIAIPIDSLDPRLQQKLRGKPFIKVHQNFGELSDQIKREGFDLGYHTVLNYLNSKEISKMYSVLNKHKFDYWRIYEFNDSLPWKSLILFLSGKSDEIFDKEVNFFQNLQGPSSIMKGGIDSVLAKFLLTEREMKKKRDPRVQFVGVHDAEKPYIFVHPDGEVSFYADFSYDARRTLGNILKIGADGIRQRVQQLNPESISSGDLEEDFTASILTLPLFARIWRGDFDIDPDQDNIQLRYLEEILRLSAIYNARQMRLGKEPKATPQAVMRSFKCHFGFSKSLEQELLNLLKE